VDLLDQTRINVLLGIVVGDIDLLAGLVVDGIQVNRSEDVTFTRITGSR
jgi:hypothetical protein